LIFTGNYKCEQCNTTFKGYAGLNMHNAWLHPDPGAVPSDQRTCTICNETYRNSSRAIHMWLHKSKEEKDELLAAGKGPRVHKPTNINCKFCHKLVAFTSNRVRHEQICAKNPKTDKKITTPTTGPNMNIPCEICGKIIKHTSYIPTHWWTHMNAQEREEAKAKGEAPEQTKQWDKDIQCPICGIFVASTYITRHAEIHKKPEDRKRLSCDFPGCTKTFLTVQALREHKLLIHNPEEFKNWINCPGKNLIIKC
jgi:hypothetical protein